jgi:hypothetical protein
MEEEGDDVQISSNDVKECGVLKTFEDENGEKYMGYYLPRDSDAAAVKRSRAESSMDVDEVCAVFTEKLLMY